MTRTELAHREAELKSQIDDLGDMLEDGLISWDLFNEEIARVATELKLVKHKLAYLNSDFSASQRYD